MAPPHGYRQPFVSDSIWSSPGARKNNSDVIGFEMSQNAKVVAEMLQKPKPKPPKMKPTSPSEAQDAAASKVRVVECDAQKQDDWGELHTGKPSPAIFILDLNNKKVLQMPGQEAEVSYGQPQWTPEGGLLLVQPACCNH
jgi:hypothetical protein